MVHINVTIRRLTNNHEFFSVFNDIVAASLYVENVRRGFCAHFEVRQELQLRRKPSATQSPRSIVMKRIHYALCRHYSPLRYWTGDHYWKLFVCLTCSHWLARWSFGKVDCFISNSDLFVKYMCGFEALRRYIALDVWNHYLNLT